MPSVSEHLRTTLQAEKRASTARYDELIASIVDGNDDVDFDAALIVVKEAGKTADDYDRDVARLQRIKTLEAIIATEPDIARKMQELNDARQVEMDKDKAELREIEARQAAIKGRDGLYLGASEQLRQEQTRIITARLELQRLRAGQPAALAETRPSFDPLAKDMPMIAHQEGEIQHGMIDMRGGDVY